MEYRFELSKNVKDFIKDAKVDEIGIGCSDSQVIKINKKENIYFLKIASTGLLKSEYEKLMWLNKKISKYVPEVILYEQENNIEYLITKALPGEMVCSDYYLNHPNEGIEIVIDAFNKIYSIDIKDCPFDVSLDYKLKLVKNNIDNGYILEENINEEILKKYGSIEDIYNYLIENKFDEELVFSHGDISLPNIFAYNNELSGFIDVGDCGIADKWFDIAIMTRTLIMNYGKEYLDIFYKKMNIEPDNFKINYYLTMMELYL